MHRWKGLENSFPMVYYTPNMYNILVTKLKRKIHSCLATADHAGQKKHIRFRLTFFGHSFLLVLKQRNLIAIPNGRIFNTKNVIKVSLSQKNKLTERERMSRLVGLCIFV